MTWVNNFLRYCTFGEIRKEAEKRGIIPTPLPPPVILGEINSSALHTMLPGTYINHIDGKTYNVRKDVWMNKVYKLTSVDEIKRFLKWNLIDKEKYEEDYFDCDSYAWATMGAMKLWGRGLCFGLCVIPGHAKNWFLDEKRQIWEAEPSSDHASLSEGKISHYFL